METLFVLTHTVMLTCLISMIYISIPGMADNTRVVKPSFVVFLITKLRSMQINITNISRIATALLTIFLN